MSHYVIRPAVEADQAAIKTLVRTAGINPMGLEWPRFLVADDDGKIIGAGQVKPHKDGSREVASIAVIPDRQGQGIATAIIQALIERESGPLHLMCQQDLEGFYGRAGFRRIDGDELPPYFRRIIRLAQIMAPVVSIVRREEMRLIVMKRDQPAVVT